MSLFIFSQCPSLSLPSFSPPCFAITSAKPCKDNWYLCDNGKCILEGYTCDSDNDCGDWSDEKHDICSEWTRLSAQCAVSMVIEVVYWKCVCVCACVCVCVCVCVCARAHVCVSMQTSQTSQSVSIMSAVLTAEHVFPLLRFPQPAASRAAD